MERIVPPAWWTLTEQEWISMLKCIAFYGKAYSQSHAIAQLVHFRAIDNVSFVPSQLIEQSCLRVSQSMCLSQSPLKSATTAVAANWELHTKMLKSSQTLNRINSASQTGWYRCKWLSLPCLRMSFVLTIFKMRRIYQCSAFYLNIRTEFRAVISENSETISTYRKTKNSTPSVIFNSRHRLHCLLNPVWGIPNQERLWIDF